MASLKAKAEIIVTTADIRRTSGGHLASFLRIQLESRDLGHAKDVNSASEY